MNQFQVVTLDFETFYDAAYTLKKQTTSEYVRDPRFEVIGVGVRETCGDCGGVGGFSSFTAGGSIRSSPCYSCDTGVVRRWFEAADFRKWAEARDWSRRAVLAHHTHFDGLILAHHFGIIPGFYLDTLSMARALHGTDVGGSLAALSQHYQVGEKGHEVEDAKGKHRSDFTPEEWQQYGRYCLLDTDLTYAIFRRMAEGYPEDELDLIDQTIRMFTNPKFVLDKPRLERFLAYEQDRKAELLQRIGADRPTLQSSDKLCLAFEKLGVEPPMKAGKHGPIPAFAKSDAGMQDLLEDSRDEVRWLAEARIAVKSTINETRTGRLLRMADHGPMPIYLKYAGAHTHRDAGGDKINPQNFQRGGEIRNSITVEGGYKIVVADSAQIEARTNAYLGGHEALVLAFAQNRDVYSEFASTAFRRPVDRKKNKEDFIPGFVGKTCFAGETPVLTHRGWVAIAEVQNEDLVWDGVEWVPHGGVIDQGVREVWEKHSVAATPDHEILTAHGWREWQEVLTSPSLFRSALDSTSLPASAGNDSRGQTEPRARTTQSCVARVVGRGESTGRTFSPARVRAATGAPRRSPPESGTGNTSPQWPTTPIASDFSTGSVRASLAATTTTTRTTPTTAVEGSASSQVGAPTARPSSNTFKHSRGGTSPNSKWTESTWMGGMSPATFGSSLPQTTCATDARLESCSSGSQILKRRTRTYDVSSAGPRHRFTILTDLGPIVVHNCVLGLGYGMGWQKFAATLLAGALGGPPVVFDRALMESLGVSLGEFTSDPRKVQRVREMKTRLAYEDLLVHCAVAEEFVRQYRSENQAIVRFWGQLQDTLPLLAAVGEGERLTPPWNSSFAVQRHALAFPTGLPLRYPGLREDYGEGWSYYGGKRKPHVRLYGGKVCENVVQKFARNVVFDQALTIQRKTGYRPSLRTHDELVFVAPESEAEALLETVLSVMKTAPAWAPGLPLNAEGGVGDRYGEIK